MNSFIINLKEKGRGFALRSELYALSNQPLPGPFLNRKGVYPCEDNKFP